MSPWADVAPMTDWWPDVRLILDLACGGLIAASVLWLLARWLRS